MLWGKTKRRSRGCKGGNDKKAAEKNIFRRLIDNPAMADWF